MATGWTQVGSTWYYLNAAGDKGDRRLKDGGSWYYPEPPPDGATATGRLKDGGSGTTWIPSGAMTTGWLDSRVRGTTFLEWRPVDRLIDEPTNWICPPPDEVAQ